MAKVETITEQVRELLREQYAHPVVVSQSNGKVAVLAGKAFEHVQSKLDDQTRSMVVELDTATLPWFSVPEQGLRLWRQYAKDEANGELVTELEEGDPPVQIVMSEENWDLLKTADGAQGWIRRTNLELLDSGWVQAHTQVTSTDIVREALTFKGVPYVWGGTTDAGVDCSGVVQRVLWRTAKQWLPRHSRALLGVGDRVKPSAVLAGDILILKRKSSEFDTHPMHVAIAITSDEVLHASRDAMRVVCEPIEMLVQRYKVLGVRRVWRASN